MVTENYFPQNAETGLQAPQNQPAITLPALFVDMDCVLADFVAAACTVAGITQQQFETAVVPNQWGVHHVVQRLRGEPYALSDMEATIRAAGAAFWADMPPLPTVQWFIDLAEQVFPGNWYILTTPMRTHDCHVGKLLWVETHVPQALEHVIITQHKHLLASPGRVLVDDTPHNCQRWEEHGGFSVLYPAWHNPLHSLFERHLDHYERHLHSFNLTNRKVLDYVMQYIEQQTASNSSFTGGSSNATQSQPG